jgi:SOS-response transcriptional repressor LexA
MSSKKKALSMSPELEVVRKRVAELQEALGAGGSHQQFADHFKVNRVAALRWLRGVSPPSVANYIQMAKASTACGRRDLALWFLKQAGIDRGVLEDLFPEFERLSRESERRIKKMASEQSGKFTNVPILRSPAPLEAGRAPSADEIEEWLPLQPELVPNPGSTYAVRIGDVFVHPMFAKGSVIVVDIAQKDVTRLDEEIVLVKYTVSPHEKEAHEALLRHGKQPRFLTWPHLQDGLYLGRLVREREGPRPGWHHRVLVEHGIRGRNEEWEGFSVCVGAFRRSAAFNDGTHYVEFDPEMLEHPSTKSPDWNLETHETDNGLLGRVICWMAAAESAQIVTSGNPSMKNPTQKPKKK